MQHFVERFLCSMKQGKSLIYFRDFVVKNSFHIFLKEGAYKVLIFYVGLLHNVLSLTVFQALIHLAAMSICTKNNDGHNILNHKHAPNWSIVFFLETLRICLQNNRTASDQMSHFNGQTDLQRLGDSDGHVGQGDHAVSTAGNADLETGFHGGLVEAWERFPGMGCLKLRGGQPSAKG